MSISHGPVKQTSKQKPPQGCTELRFHRITPLRINPQDSDSGTSKSVARGYNKSVVFVLDNYDSFTYNLVQYLGELGAQVEVRRNNEVSIGEIEAMHPERIVISPGPCTPQDAGISIELIRHFAGKVPLLGVCLGHQAIGAAFGGRVIRAKNLMHGKTSHVEHDGKTIFRDLSSPMTATRYHSLIVAEDGLPDDLEVSAWTHDHDGTRVIMGLRHRKFPIEGVQFHPESVLTDEGKKLVANFLQR
jgi:anthranilate synthase/aminodeoxychorismate synthase-like glutamine amidotransferase